MNRIRRLDREDAVPDCRFTIQSQSVEDAIALAHRHGTEVHGKDLRDGALREDHVEVAPP